MTISDRRLDRVWRTKVAPVVGSVEGWTSVTPNEEGSSWVAAEATSPLIFERDRARLGEDLAATWRDSERAVLLPLAPVMQRLSERASPADPSATRQISSTVYEMQ
jgi:hypothetical protein